MAGPVDERFPHVERSVAYDVRNHAGSLAASAWLGARGLTAPPRAPWEVTATLDAIELDAMARFRAASDTCLHVGISSTEWGFFFCHHSRASWIRVTDVPFVHERDDFGLLERAPPLRDLGRLVRELEERHRIKLRRERAEVRSSIPGAEAPVRAWLGML